LTQDGEISLFGDATHLQEIMDSLHRQASEPDTLPAASEQVIADVTGSSTHWVCPVRLHQSFSCWKYVCVSLYNVARTANEGNREDHGNKQVQLKTT